MRILFASLFLTGASALVGPSKNIIGRSIGSSIKAHADPTTSTPELPKVPLLGSVPFLIPSVLKGLGSPSNIKPDIQAILRDAHQSNGKNFKMTMPGAKGERVMSFVSDLDDAEYILEAATKEFPDRGWLLDGLKHRLPFSLNAMPDDDRYKQHRTSIVQAFKKENLDAYFDATVFECEELGDKLNGIMDGGESVVEITEIFLEHIMLNFGASVIGRTYTSSNSGKLEQSSWQLQLGSLFDLVLPRSLRFRQAEKDKRALETIGEIVDATVKSEKIKSKQALRKAFAKGLGKEPKYLTAEENNGLEGLSKEQFFKAARMDRFRPELQDIIFSYIIQDKKDHDKANLKEFMDHLQQFIDNRIRLYYDITCWKNNGVFELDLFIRLLAPHALEDLSSDDERSELIATIQDEISGENRHIDDVSLRENLRKDKSTLGDLLSKKSKLSSVGKQVQRIFGTSRSLLQNIVTSPNKKGLILPMDEVYDSVTNTLLAGYFSTAMTTKWIVWKLAQEKEWQNKIYRELKDFGGFRKLAVGTLSKDMPTSRAFIYECMRVFPTVPVHARRANQSIDLPSNFTILEDELVIVNNFHIFNDITVWGESADSFDPTRWMKDNYLDKNHIPQGPPDDVVTKCPVKNVMTAASKYAYAPFGHGHRACPAPEFALSVIQLTLLKCVEQAEMEPHQNPVTAKVGFGDVVIPSIGFAIGNIGGCYLKLRKR